MYINLGGCKRDPKNNGIQRVVSSDMIIICASVKPIIIFNKDIGMIYFSIIHLRKTQNKGRVNKFDDN